MWDFLARLFQTDFMPHGYCYMWRPGLLWLHAISDTLIALSYFSIPAALLYFVRRRRDLPFHWMFVMFGLFIFGCGTTHVMEVWTIWVPQYRLAGLIKLLTAAVSGATAVLLIPTIPKALALPHPDDLRRALREKEEEMAERKKAEASLRSLSAQLLRLQDQERHRLARELHDSLGQYLAALGWNLSILNAAREDLRKAPQKAIDDSIRLASQCGAEIRTISYLLHPPELDMMGLEPAVRSYVEGFSERSGIRVDLDFPPELGRLGEDIELTLFRIIQECLTNILRHSNCKGASIRLTATRDEMTLEVSDEGGAVSSDLSQSSQFGVGIAGMRERVKALNGKFEIRPSKLGTSVFVAIPLARCEP